MYVCLEATLEETLFRRLINNHSICIGNVGHVSQENHWKDAAYGNEDSHSNRCVVRMQAALSENCTLLGGADPEQAKNIVKVLQSAGLDNEEVGLLIQRFPKVLSHRCVRFPT